MGADSDRRKFLLGGAALAGGLLPGAVAAQDQPPAKDDPHAGHGAGGGGQNYGPTDPGDRYKLTPGRRKSGEPPVAVEHPDVGKLPWKLVNGAKEFHLYARHMKREFLPDQWFDVWGYGAEPGPTGSHSMPGMPAKAKDGSMPGPTIEVVEGDRVRVVVHNELPEPTSMHWHGIDVPNGMDGVIGLNQDAIPPGGTFTYEFELKQNGTFFYHTHVAMQQAMGMVGLFIIHPKAAWDPPVDRDFALILQEWAILPGASVTNTMSMEFNLFTINGRAAPYVTPMVVRQGDRVRIRFVNFSVIDHHPMHLHGVTFWITGTEAGRLPVTAWVPRNNVLVGVAQAYDIEFVAWNPGDWMLHCHMFHHMMNFMSSMAGTMGGHTARGTPAGGGMATGMGMITRGPALSGEFGAQLGRGTGENTGTDRAVGNGPMAGGQPGMKGMDIKGMTVPGFPQDMSGMSSYSPAELRKLTKPETRGMRNGWFADVEGLTTLVRVLPPDLYDKVVSGTGEVAPGASVPGAGPGKPSGHEGHGGMKMDPPAKGHEGMKMDPPKEPSPKKDEHEGHKK